MKRCTPSELKQYITKVLNVNLVPAVWGSPGIGKSHVIRDIANELNLWVIDLRLSQLEAVDLNGLPDRQDARLVWLPPAAIPLDTDRIPDGYSGWLLFLDELNSAAVDVQKAAYKLILDRMVGQYKLHPACFIAAAGNLTTDRAITYRMPTPLQSRMIHFVMETDIDDWLAWAQKNNIDERIIGFLRYHKDMLYTFNPDSDNYTYACPRTWEFASRLISGEQKLEFTLLEAVIGSAAASAFIGFVNSIKDLVPFSVIIDNPHMAPVMQSSDKTLAVLTLLLNKIDATNYKPILAYVKRYDFEHQYYFFNKLNVMREKAEKMKDTKRFAVYTAITRSSEFIEWATEYAENIL